MGHFILATISHYQVRYLSAGLVIFCFPCSPFPGLFSTLLHPSLCPWGWIQINCISQTFLSSCFQLVWAMGSTSKGLKGKRRERGEREERSGYPFLLSIAALELCSGCGCSSTSTGFHFLNSSIIPAPACPFRPRSGNSPRVLNMPIELLNSFHTCVDSFFIKISSNLS